MRVAVLGAGVVGVTAAWCLARDGHVVTLVDRRDGAALETSFANGGQISADHAEPWAKPSVIPKVLRWIGREDAPLLFRPRADARQWRWALGFALECLPGRFERNTRMLAGLARFSRACLAEIRAQTRIEYHRVAKGILHFCTLQRDFEALAAHAQAMQSAGVRREVKSAAECLVLEPALRDSRAPVVGGIYAQDDESGDAHVFATALARHAETLGVRFLAGTRALGLELDAGQVRAVRTSGERLEADAVVVCLGSESPLFLAPLGISLPVYPLKGYSVTLPVSDALQDAAPTVSLTDEAHKLVVSRFGARLRCAGTAELAGYDTSVNRTRCDAILDRLRTLFPRLSQSGPAEYWAGLRPATPSNVPVIGRAGFPNLYLNTGHGTLGWTLAAGSGRALADLVSGRHPEVDFAFRDL